MDNKLLENQAFEVNTKLVLQIKAFMKKHRSYLNTLLRGDINEKGSKNIELKQNKTFNGFDNKGKEI